MSSLRPRHLPCSWMIASAACLAIAVAACHDDAEPSPGDVGQSRGDAVQAKPNAEPASTPAPAPRPVAPPAKRAFCSSGSSTGMDAPDEDVSQRHASGTPVLPDRIQTGNGRFTWINLWAAWCVPCKQEIPLLKSWERQLRASNSAFRLTFVSLDDDSRQLDAFLEGQPADGIKSSYWLREGNERDTWLKAAKINVDTELPAHLLVDSKGKVRCFISGAIEPDDFPKLQQVLAQ